MQPDSVQDICETRILIGFLGEKQQTSWWGSSFLASSSKVFLGPIYPNSIDVAQYSGVCQAASIVHDEHIGIGKHYHLYRLPDAVERGLFKYIQAHQLLDNISCFLTNRDTAIKRLKELGDTAVEKSEGPVPVGQYADDKLDSLIQISRSHYIKAFEREYRTFPYMRCI